MLVKRAWKRITHRPCQSGLAEKMKHGDAFSEEEGEQRYQYLAEKNSDNEQLYFSDTNGMMVMYWTPKTLDRATFVSEEKRSSKEIKTALGYIRNQFVHDLCWAFSSADLVSTSLVLYGWEENYIPLCPLDMNEGIDSGESGKHEDASHSCKF